MKGSKEIANLTKVFTPTDLIAPFFRNYQGKEEPDGTMSKPALKVFENALMCYGLSIERFNEIFSMCFNAMKDKNCEAFVDFTDKIDRWFSTEGEKEIPSRKFPQFNLKSYSAVLNRDYPEEYIYFTDGVVNDDSLDAIARRCENMVYFSCSPIGFEVCLRKYDENFVPTATNIIALNNGPEDSILQIEKLDKRSHRIDTYTAEPSYFLEEPIVREDCYIAGLFGNNFEQATAQGE